MNIMKKKKNRPETDEYEISFILLFMTSYQSEIIHETLFS